MISRAIWLSLILYLYGCAGIQEPPAALPSHTPQATPTAQPSESPTTTIMTPNPALTSTPQGSSPITAEEYAVYDAMIESTFLPFGVEMILIVDQTTPGRSSETTSQQQLDYLQENLVPDLQAETLADFAAKNDRSYQIGNYFNLDVPVVSLSNGAIEEIFASEDGWERIYDQYPKSQGLMRLSRVGFNSNNEQALMYVGNQADFTAGQGDYVLLSKEGGKWKVKQTVLAWIS